MDVPLCQHMKPDGIRCGTPAIRDHKYCYHHTTVRKLVPKTQLHGLFMEGESGEPYKEYELPYPECGDAIQIGFMQLMHGISSGLIPEKRAQIMLSALHGAAANLRAMEKAARKAKAGCEVIKAAPKKKPESVKSVSQEERA
jgi:hypothetical protein